jgi:Na+/pantothenate symporter
MDIAITILYVMSLAFIVSLAWIGSPPTVDKWIKDKLTRSK